MELTPITRKENFLAKAAGDPNALDLDPITREEWFISQIQGGGGGGGSITIDDTMDPSSENPLQNKVITNEFALLSQDLDLKESKPTVTDVSGTTPTITPAANTNYNCGELTSLTISNPPATGAYSIVFTSGATPTQTIIPPVPAMRWQTDNNEPPQGFPAANTRYEINVKDTYVVLGEWPVPEVSA